MSTRREILFLGLGLGIGIGTTGAALLGSVADRAATPSLAAAPPRVEASSPAPQFRAWALIVEADVALTAYEVDVQLTGPATLVGVEGGEPPFEPPPYYDPAAMTIGRIIVAGIASSPAAGRRHVATLHVHASGPRTHHAAVRVAADAAGRPIPARAWLTPLAPVTRP